MKEILDIFNIYIKYKTESGIHYSVFTSVSSLRSVTQVPSILTGGKQAERMSWHLFIQIRQKKQGIGSSKLAEHWSSILAPLWSSKLCPKRAYGACSL